MKNILLFSVAVILMFTSCEDLLTKNLELEEFDYENQLAISGTLNSAESNLRILVGENQAITDPFNGWVPITNAEAFLFRDETLVGQLTYQEMSQGQGQLDDLYVLDLENIDIVPGEYRIEVEHPTLGKAIATTEIPEDVPLIEIEFVEDYGIAPNLLEKADAVLITFNDPPGNNYYNVSIETKSTSFDTILTGMDTIFLENQFYFDIDTNEPNAQIMYDNFLVSDDFFNGKEHTIVVYIFNYNNEELVDILDDIELSWEMLSRDKYEFDISLENYYNAQNLGPFSESVSLFNNVEGGLGVFSGLTRKLYDIQ